MMSVYRYKVNVCAVGGAMIHSIRCTEWFFDFSGINIRICNSRNSHEASCEFAFEAWWNSEEKRQKGMLGT
jgi:hypothetical protein